MYLLMDIFDSMSEDENSQVPNNRILMDFRQCVRTWMSNRKA
jgi:hypothetical protein